MASDPDDPVPLQSTRGTPVTPEMERTFLQTQQDLVRRTEELARSEAHLRSALKAGRLVHWETDLLGGTRQWTPEAMELFGLNLPEGRGRFGGEADEFRMAMHPDDRHLAQTFYALADRQDWFPAEYRIIKADGSIRWLSGGGQVIERSSDGRAARMMNVVADVTDRKLAEEHNKMLMRELSHRAKNLLAVILSIATQTGRNAKSLDEFKSQFTLRLQSLAASHDLLVMQDWQGAVLAELVRDQLAPFIQTEASRLRASGPDVMVSPKAAEALGLALHELATNAVKYGALSVPAGHVSIAWEWDSSPERPGALQLRWVEQGGPPVTPPAHKGFGYIVCQRVVADLVGGAVEIEFLPEGLRWSVSIPASNVVTVARDTGQRS